MANTSCFTINEGSTFRVEFNFPDGNGGNADFTGFTVGISDADDCLGGLQATLVDPANALVELLLQDTSDLNEGSVFNFRVSYTQPNGDVGTTNKLGIMVV